MLDDKVRFPIVIGTLRETQHLSLGKQTLAVLHALDRAQVVATIAELQAETPGEMHTRPNRNEKRAAFDQREKKRDDYRKVIAELVDADEEGRTSFEVAAARGMVEYTAAPRCSELKNKFDPPLVYDTGEDRASCGHTPSSVWRLTPYGYEIAEELGLT